MRLIFARCLPFLRSIDKVNAMSLDKTEAKKRRKSTFRDDVKRRMSVPMTGITTSNPHFDVVPHDLIPSSKLEWIGWYRTLITRHSNA